MAPWAEPSDAHASRGLRDSLRGTARRVAADALGLRAPSEEAVDAYAGRLWGALQTHFAKRNIDPQTVEQIEEFVAEIESGKLHYGQVRENVVVDVIVAMGLERHENEAATVFQNNYMPIVRFHADRFAGQRGVDTVENLAADLVLPRTGRRPKIATYRGLTPLKSWLRSVVVNKCVGAHRKQRETSLDDTVVAYTEDTVQASAQATDCEKKLAPTFKSAVGNLPPTDRVLLKMLILDGVSQKTLASSQGVDSGTLTRRRQKAAGKLLEEIHRIGNSGGSGASDNGCLELLLAGDAADLQARLASLLAAQFREREGEPS